MEVMRSRMRFTVLFTIVLLLSLQEVRGKFEAVDQVDEAIGQVDEAIGQVDEVINQVDGAIGQVDEADQVDEAIDQVDEAESAKVELFEGDIVVTPGVEDVVLGRTPLGEDMGGQWTGRIVPYTFKVGHEVYLDRIVKSAIAEYNRQLNGCLMFREFPSRRELTRAGCKNYIVFFVGQGCYSSLGMTGGEQKISLGEGCTRHGTVMHEIMHSLGFWHEQSRVDRDKHISIVWKNIEPSMRGNFGKYNNPASPLDLPYDIDSVMHYPPLAFSKNGRQTIIAKDGRMNFGMQQSLSKIDIEKIKIYYRCPTSTNTVSVGKVDGGWTEWQMGSCSRNCGGGTQKATRSCTKPSPKNGGQKCSGKSIYTAKCNTTPCLTPVSSCVDKHQYCNNWAKTYCTLYRLYMEKVCSKACDFCR